MLYSLYNAMMGEDEWIMQSGSPRMRGDGTPWVYIRLTLSKDKIGTPFWLWREEVVPEMLHSCPEGILPGRLPPLPAPAYVFRSQSGSVRLRTPETMPIAA